MNLMPLRLPVFLVVLCAANALANAQTTPTTLADDAPGTMPASPAGELTGDRVYLATLNANYRVAFEEIARRYMARNPHIEVEVQIVPINFETWIRTRFAAGGNLIPDIYNGNYTIGYDLLGYWVSLNEYYEQVNPYTGRVWSESLDMHLVERYKVAGELYYVPLDYIEIAIFYNRRIFDELGLREPATWEDFLELCARIEATGDYAPFAIGGNAQSLWAGDFGWLVRLFGDVYLRNHVPDVMARPGDWDYDPSRNAGFQYDGDDPYADLMVALNVERVLNAVADGTIDPRNANFRRVYERMKELSRYFQRGYMGADPGAAYQMFLQQKAAMMLQTSAGITGMVRDFKRMSPEDRFEFGSFFFPPITGDELAQGPFRGVGGAGVNLVVTNKRKLEPTRATLRHERNVVDFLMFLTAPENAQLLIDLTLEEEQPIHGPLAIRDARLPAEYAEQLEAFLGHGYEKLNFRGLEDEQESVAEWVVIAQEYFGGRLSLDEFSERYSEVLRAAIPRLQHKRGYDLDPTTEDDPPVYDREPSRLNPFENGTLMLGLLIVAFAVFAFVCVRRARGPRRQLTSVAYMLLFPTMLLLGAFNYFPALSGLYHAFTEWEEGRVAVFNGLENFRRMAGDEVFLHGIWNMFIMLTASLFKATVVPFIAAELILALASDRLRYFFRTAFLVPMVVPGMVIILIWQFIYNPSTGLINQALATVGLENLTQNWLGEPSLALPSIIFMGFPWIGAFGLLIFMAGLMDIPESVYESYRLESDNVWRRIWSVDLPLVRGQFRLLTILTFIGSLQDFQAILIMTDGGPGLSTTVPALRMYHQAFRFTHYGYGSAIGLFLFVLIFSITLINLKLIRSQELE